jgi:hypothetical protein
MPSDETDETIPEMPADFASATPDTHWQRIQRASRQKARVEADLRTARERLAELEGVAAKVGTYEAQIAEITAAREAAEARAASLELRIPLLKEGIEDDEVAGLVIQRWQVAQKGKPANEQKPLPDWIHSDAASDRLAAPFLKGGGKPIEEKPKMGDPTRGTSAVVQPDGVKVSREAYASRVRELAHLGDRAYDEPLISAYFAQNNIPRPGSKRK